MEHLQAALRATMAASTMAASTAPERIYTIARQVAYFGYLSLDTLVWVRLIVCLEAAYSFVFSQTNGIKFTRFTSETSQKIQKISNQFWLAGILFSLLNGVAKVRVIFRRADDMLTNTRQSVRIHQEAAKLKAASKTEKDLGSETDRKAKALGLKAARAATLHQFTIDTLDVWIPASGLGLTNVNDGVLGVFGYVWFWQLTLSSY